MKKFLLMILFAGSIAMTNAQLRKIPAEVTNAFAEKYPHATDVEWRDKLDYFEATFKLNNSTITADFSSKGEWQESESNLNFDDLPDEVRDGFSKSKYADWTKNSISEIQQLAEPLEYKISVQKSDIQKKNLWFDTNGRLIKESITL